MKSLPPLTFDVRPLFGTARAPLPAILAEIDRLAPGQSFLLIAPLDPVPLAELLRKRGFSATSTAQADGSFHVLFVPTEDSRSGVSENT